MYMYALCNFALLYFLLIIPVFIFVCYKCCWHIICRLLLHCFTYLYLWFANMELWQWAFSEHMTDDKKGPFLQQCDYWYTVYCYLWYSEYQPGGCNPSSARKQHCSSYGNVWSATFASVQFTCDNAMLSPLFPVLRNQLQRPPIYEQFCVMWHGRCTVTVCCVSSGGEESLDMNEIAEPVSYTHLTLPTILRV